MPHLKVWGPAPTCISLAIHSRCFVSNNENALYIQISFHCIWAQLAGQDTGYISKCCLANIRLETCFPKRKWNFSNINLSPRAGTLIKITITARLVMKLLVWSSRIPALLRLLRWHPFLPKTFCNVKNNLHEQPNSLVRYLYRPITSFGDFFLICIHSQPAERMKSVAGRNSFQQFCSTLQLRKGNLCSYSSAFIEHICSSHWIGMFP